MSLMSDDNKAVLWQVLSSHPGVQGDSAEFQDRFERTLEEIQGSASAADGPAPSLTELNKQVLRRLTQAPIRTAYKRSAPQGVTQERAAERAVFDRRLKAQQDDLASKIAPPKPKAIDFRDLEDWRPVRDIDQAIAERAADLTKITAKYNEDGAKEWIGVPDKKVTSAIQIDRASEVSLEVTELRAARSGQDRRVRFAGEDGNALLAKLKRKPAQGDALSAIRRDIKLLLDNQAEILRRLGPGPQELLPSSTL